MTRSWTPSTRRRLARLRFGGAMSLFAAAVLVSSAGLPAAQPLDNFTPVTDALLEDPDPADWLHWRRTLDAWGHSPLDEITADNGTSRPPIPNGRRFPACCRTAAWRSTGTRST